MPKRDSVPCPACGEIVPVRIGATKKKPYIRCDCGLVAHATKEKAIRAFMGDDPKGTPAPAPAAAVAGGKKKKSLDEEFFQ